MGAAGRFDIGSGGIARAFAASLAIHFAVLFGVGLSEPRGPAGARFPHGSHALDARLLPAPSPRQATSGELGAGMAPDRPPEPVSAVTEVAPAEDSRGVIDIPDILPWRHYLQARDLDVPPQVIIDVPVDPPELRRYPEGGQLVLELWIDELGRVVRTEAESGNLPAAFIDSARGSFAKSTFSPGLKDGRPVKSRLKVEVTYAGLPPDPQRPRSR